MATWISTPGGTTILPRGEDMAQEWAKGFYKSATWLRCRHGYITSVHGLCERCFDPGYILHHKILLTAVNIKDQEITLNWDHLELLCLSCHNLEHGIKTRGEAIREGLAFDEHGNMIDDSPPIK